VAADLGFTVLYAPGPHGAAGHGEGRAAGAARDVPSGDFGAALEPPGADDPAEMRRTGTSVDDYRRLILAEDRRAFLERYPLDVGPTTDDRPFFFHTTRLANQFDVAFGRSMLFGNGLSALLTLMGISGALVALFIVGPLVVGGGRPGPGWAPWLLYFGALGTGFMLLEVALLQHFVLLLGHPVYSLTVTLFSLLLGTGVGSLVSRRVAAARVGSATVRALVGVLVAAVAGALLLPPLIDAVMPWPLVSRVLVAGLVLFPLGVLLGMPLPGGMRLLAAGRQDLVPWAWGMNGAFSVVGATLAVFIAMNWGFFDTLLTGALVYAGAAAILSTRRTA
jgi:hypothetical protein